MNALNTPLAELDPEVHAVLRAELHRQQSTLEMIASENFAPSAVMEAQGSVLTNKYSPRASPGRGPQGYPGRRYYGGCEHVDVTERLAIERIKSLFGAGFANVQPHSGAQANTAVFFALLQPGDTILGLDLAHGGHLTHGMRLNYSGKMLNVVPYHVAEADNLVDMDEVEHLAKEHRPKMITAGWSAMRRPLDFARFRRLTDEVGAYPVADMVGFAGLVAAGLHPNRSFAVSGSESAHWHAPNGLGRTGPRRTRPRGGDTHPVRVPIPGGRFPARPGQVGTARGDGEALNHLSGGAEAPHAGAVPGVPDRKRDTICGRYSTASRRPKLVAISRNCVVMHVHDRAVMNAVPHARIPSARQVRPPGLATRGFTKEDFAEVADVIALALQPEPDTAALRARTEALAAKHPLYSHLSGPSGDAR
ncbi:serine hydroxymethyltransferase [Streptomyces sp. NPDC052236]|uniref:serine hydroxymethyltransferase n=1 Tax=Streptomyces sp. NPDC052236 TaxID=3365686 RepID=UPI0037D4845A